MRIHMKIKDYVVVKAGDADQLRSAVVDLASQGWETLGALVVNRRPWEMLQVMVKGEHFGEHWLKEPGKRGQWVKD